MQAMDDGGGVWHFGLANLRTFAQPHQLQPSVTSHPSTQPSSIYTYPHARLTSASTPGLANVHPLTGKFSFSHLCSVSTHAHPSICMTSIPISHSCPRPSAMPSTGKFSFLIYSYSFHLRARPPADPPFMSMPICQDRFFLIGN